MGMRTAAEWAVRLVVVAALTLDAVVHLRLAPGYQLGQPAGIGAGNLFRIAAAAAILAALYVLLRGSSASYAVAFTVAFGTVAAVVLHRYVDVPQIGPVPSLHEPVWFFEKTLSAVVQAMGAAAAAVGFVLTRRRPRSAGTP